MNAPNQWGTTLHCKVVSHWLGTYTKSSLYRWHILSRPSCKILTPNISSIISNMPWLSQPYTGLMWYIHPFTSWLLHRHWDKQLPQLQWTHWGWFQMAAISQKTFSHAFSWMKMYEFQLTFHWCLFLMVELMIFWHWFRYWLGTDQVTSHYLN